MAFDPDAFLAQVKPFNPDDFLSSGGQGRDFSGIDPDVPVEGRPREAVKKPDERSTIENIIGGTEAAATFGSGILAEPVAGLVGLFELARTQDPAAATRMIESVRKGMTYEPISEAGREDVQAVAETLQPVAEGIESAERFLGESTLDITGSPALAAIAHSIPTATMELIGIKGAKGIKADPSQAQLLAQSTPDINDVKTRAKNLYNEVSESGMMIADDDALDLAVDLNKKAESLGLDKTLTPKSTAVLKSIEEDLGKPLTVNDIDKMRKKAQIASTDFNNPADAKIGSAMIDEIDTFLDKQGARAFAQGGSDVGKKFREARNLWSRVKKTEIIDEALEKAKNQASGFENGLRIQFRSILNNKKKRKGFTKDEQAAMRKVVEGGGLENTFKLLGKFGVSEGQRQNALLPLIGSGAGGSAFGVTGAVAAPLVGQASLSIAQKMTRNNAKMVSDLVAAGRDAKGVTKAYFMNVPKSQRNANDLTELLLRSNVSIDDIRQVSGFPASESKLLSDVKFIAENAGNRIKSAMIAAPAVQETINQNQKVNPNE